MSSQFRLYEIEGLLRDAVAAADEAVGEDGTIPEDWAAFLDDIQLERDQKCLSVAAMVRELAAEAAAISEERKRLQARERVAENKASRLRGYLAQAVQVGERMRDTRVEIAWRKSTAVCIDDESKLPDDCFRVVREVSKRAVADGIKSGSVKAGARIATRYNLQVR